MRTYSLLLPRLHIVLFCPTPSADEVKYLPIRIETLCNIEVVVTKQSAPTTTSTHLQLRTAPLVDDTIAQLVINTHTAASLAQRRISRRTLLVDDDFQTAKLLQTNLHFHYYL